MINHGAGQSERALSRRIPIRFYGVDSYTLAAYRLRIGQVRSRAVVGCSARSHGDFNKGSELQRAFQSETALLVWPKGRLVGLEASDKGVFTTVAVVPPGRKLKINAVTQRASKIIVEVVAYHDGKPITGHTFDDCTPIVGDNHWTTVTWKDTDDLGFKEGTAIMLRFRMEKAIIFGLEFA